MARTDVSGEPLFIIDGNEEGCCDDDNKVYGTYLHGVLEQPSFRRVFLDLIDPDLVKEGVERDYSTNLELEVARVSARIKESLDMNLFNELFMEVNRCH
jgi:cobyric acid synthase